ncbi:helix-turn-helix domain-containing protein [Streptomyces chilikensis]|uniref:Helix-turn-helix transcriptional regulator n=1 Tax=Streptomyces chilikensis TaxID=1194079 RepID=A0ABV3EJJ9_9ACTN
MHYARWRKNGDPTVTRIRPTGTMRVLLLQALETETDDCILLPAKKGRPTAYVNGKGMNASRAVWVLAHGDPGEAWVLHTCHRGDEGCVNLRHLYLGDVHQNHRDTVNAGRTLRGRQDLVGSRNGRAKLTEQEADEIRRRYRVRGVRQADLAREYGVSQAVISSITLGERWVPSGQRRRSVTERRRRPTAELVTAIREAWEAGGVSQQALADRFGVGQSTVSRIIRGVR